MLRNDTQYKNSQHNDAQQNITLTSLNIFILLCDIVFAGYAECHYDKCYNIESRGAVTEAADK